METRFFEKFDLAQHLSETHVQGSGKSKYSKVLNSMKDVTRYLEAINKTIISQYEELDDEKLMDLERMMSRVWTRYISPCMDWCSYAVIERIKQKNPIWSNNRNIIAIMDRPAEQSVGNSDINAPMFALVKREQTCPMIGTNVDVRVLKDYTKNPKLILPRDRTSSDIYRAPEDSAKIWQECVDQLFSAVFNDAEPSMNRRKSGELVITVYGDEEIVEAFNNAKNKLVPPEYREKIRIFDRDDI